MLSALLVTLLSSAPVARTLEGCVIDGAFYSVPPGGDGAYPITLAGPLGDFEGKAIRVRGWLSPGDRFEPEEGAPVEVLAPRCGAASRKRIVRQQVTRLRADATYAWERRDFDEASRLLDRAFALDPRPDCDTYTDRATFLAVKGDAASAAKDLAVLRRGRCGGAKKMNPLLLGDLGAALLALGEKGLARDALGLALAACRGDWCRADLQAQLEAAKKE